VRVLKVALATCARLPELAADDRLLQEELRRRGVDARPVVWNASEAAWAAFDRVVIRSVWDYHLSLPEFLAWLDLLEAERMQVWNPAALVRANAHKSYLRELEVAGLPVVPTAWIGRGSDVDLGRLLKSRGWTDAVVKPAVSASAFRTWRVSAAEAARSECRGDFRRLLAEGDVLVQRFLPEVQREGEWSFVFFGGEFSHAVLKRPALGDFRVQEELGGSVVAALPAPSAVRDAETFASHVPRPWAYARIDGVVANGKLTLMEIELIEPQLFLSRDPMAAARLAEAVLSADGGR
jgi:glutathione synthase/RimK-type ligase-like ATP-grasp enzyme